MGLDDLKDLFSILLILMRLPLDILILIIQEISYQKNLHK